MKPPTTLAYEVRGRVARITLDRPERGNGVTLAMPGEIAASVEEANLDPPVHVIAVAGNGKGFCDGYDLVESAVRSRPVGDLLQQGPVKPAAGEDASGGCDQARPRLGLLLLPGSRRVEPDDPPLHRLTQPQCLRPQPTRL